MSPVSEPLILRPGDRLVPVGNVQEQLNAVIYAGLVVDNIYGPLTEASVREFQRRANIPQTGIVDTATWARLFNGDPLPAEAATTPMSPCGPGEEMEEVPPGEEESATRLKDTPWDMDGAVPQQVRYSVEVNRGSHTLTLLRGTSRLNTYSIAVGKPSTPTPLGTFPIRNKALNPGGPFGTRWLGLTTNGIGIHGTNVDSSIGLAVSNGCIRMHNQDVQAIFPLLNVGDTVRIIAGAAPPSTTLTYTVKRGDSLYTIAQRFGTTVAAIRAANNLRTDVINVGQVLRIPGAAAPAPAPPPPPPTAPPTRGTITYTVRPGDTLYKISLSFNTTIATIRALNNLSTETIVPGQVLRVPAPAAARTYTVRAGDTLFTIAQRFGTTVSQLQAMNNLTTSVIYVGQVLRVPAT